MESKTIYKALMLIGIFVFCFGVIGFIFSKYGLRTPFGRLPGDILIKTENVSFRFPITTCIIISLALSLVLWIFSKLQK